MKKLADAPCESNITSVEHVKEHGFSMANDHVEWL